MRETWRLQHLDYDIWQALSGARISQNRIDRIEDALVRREARENVRRDEVAHLRELVADLRIHLRDREAHIKNLEAQLRPILTHQGTVETESML